MPPRLDALQRCLCPVLTRSLRNIPSSRRIGAAQTRNITGTSTRFTESPSSIPNTDGNGNEEFITATSVADIATPEALDALTNSVHAKTVIHTGANDPHSRAFKHLLSLVDSLRSNFLMELEGYIKNGNIVPDIMLYNRLLIELTKKDDHLAPLAWVLFDDMKKRNVIPNIETYLAMLKILENSPDYIRRQEILGEMRLKWYTLTDAAWGWVIKGYLNDYQIEIAMKMVQERLDQGGVVDKGVYYRMAEQLIFVGETKEALKWTEVMWNLAEGRGVRKLWWDLLAKASEEGDVETTSAVWNRVRNSLPPMFHPSEHICNSILLCAANAGDATLTSQVFRYLQSTRFVLHEHQYALAITAHAKQGDFETCFKLLREMVRSGTPSTPHTSVPLSDVLASNLELLKKAEENLWQAQKMDYTPVPDAVEAVARAWCKLGEIENAYKLFPLFHPNPTARHYAMLLKECGARWQPDHTAYIVEEMKAKGIQPDRSCYEGLVLAFAGQTEGFLWLEEMNMEMDNSNNNNNSRGAWDLSLNSYKIFYDRLKQVGDYERAEIVKGIIEDKENDRLLPHERNELAREQRKKEMYLAWKEQQPEGAPRGYEQYEEYVRALRNSNVEQNTYGGFAEGRGTNIAAKETEVAEEMIAGVNDIEVADIADIVDMADMADMADIDIVDTDLDFEPSSGKRRHKGRA
ncbi:hypothetical protein BZA77DRAFT_158353 [Pyronema omphalodes]|nr:hypothetical protein BZA77DRAFT_158353 [Pyronema omphalodes]